MKPKIKEEKEFKDLLIRTASTLTDILEEWVIEYNDREMSEQDIVYNLSNLAKDADIKYESLKEKFNKMLSDKQASQVKTAWVDHLQNVYTDFNEFLAWDEIYKLSGRLGFNTPEEAWEANPVVHGSTYPDEYRIATEEDVRKDIMQKSMGMSDEDASGMIAINDKIDREELPEEDKGRRLASIKTSEIEMKDKWVIEVPYTSFMPITEKFINEEAEDIMGIFNIEDIGRHNMEPYGIFITGEDAEEAARYAFSLLYRNPEDVARVSSLVHYIPGDPLSKNSSRNKIKVVAESLINNPTEYIYKITYEVITQESAAEGDAAERGWEVEQSDIYDDLEDLVRSVANKHTWIEWSSIPAQSGDWINSEVDTDMHTGNDTSYSLFIEHADGTPLNDEEIKFVSKALRIRTGWRGASTKEAVTPPGKEKLVRKLKKEYGKGGKCGPKCKEKAYATAWSIKNKGKKKAEIKLLAEELLNTGDGLNLAISNGSAFYIPWSSWFDANYDKWNLDLFKLIIERNGGKVLTIKDPTGWGNQPDVVIFDADAGMASRIEEDLEKELGTPWVMVVPYTGEEPKQ